MKDKIIIKDRVYIPVHAINKRKTKEQYTEKMYQEDKCRKCEYKAERFGPACEACAAYLGEILLYKMKTIDDVHYIGLPVGDKSKIESRLGIDYNDFKIVDKRSKVKFDYKIKLTIKPYDYQVALINEFKKKGYGLIEAPPRTGKTLITLALAIDYGFRFVLIADQIEFLDQFLWHIEGNEEEGIPKCTNLPELQKKAGKKLYGFPKTDEDFKTMQIMVMTYQSLNPDTKNGRARLKKLMKNVGGLGVDEVHSSAAPVFSSVINQTNTFIRFGVTGTVERKDGKEKFVKKIIGPVVARTEREAMTPKVFLTAFDHPYKRPPAHFTFAMQRLAKNEKRNEAIVDRAIKDVSKGHSIVIPVMFKKHCLELVAAINKKAGKNIAESFMGGGGKVNKEKRKAVLRRAKLGETKVVVGIRKLLQRGINVPEWSCIYTVMPINNKPNYKQETSRIRTPKEGKRTPILRIFFDVNLGISIGCAKSCLKHVQQFKYMISNDAKTQECIEILGSKKRKGEYNEDDQFKPVSMWKL